SVTVRARVPMCVHCSHKVSQSPSICPGFPGGPLTRPLHARFDSARFDSGISFAAGGAETSVLPPTLSRSAGHANLFMKYGSRISAGAATAQTPADATVDEVEAAKTFT